MAADEGVRPLLRAFARPGGRRLRLPWPRTGTWYPVSPHRRTTAPTELPYGPGPREPEVLTRAAVSRAEGSGGRRASRNLRPSR